MNHQRLDESRKTSGLSAATLGFVAGLRSQLPLAILANAAKKGSFAEGTGSPLRFLRSRWALPVFDVLAIGEITADKTPFVPNRIDPGPLAGREVIGGLAGAAIFKNAGRPLVAGLAIGMACAAAGSFSGYHARSFLHRRTGLPDVVWAVAEDALALGLGTLAIRRFVES